MRNTISLPDAVKATEGTVILNSPQKRYPTLLTDRTYAILGWAVDFVRALKDRPLWARILFRIVVGKYAYREFIGLMDDLDRDGFSPYFSYELENVRYHADPVPSRWWVERDPLPLKKVGDSK